MQKIANILLLLLFIAGAVFAQSAGNCLFFGQDYYYAQGSLPASYSNYTISMWIKRLGWQSNIFPAIVSSGVYMPSFYLEFNGNATVSYFRQNLDFNNPPTFFPLSDIPTGQWHHIAFVKNGSTISAYLDGVFKASITDNTPFGNSWGIHGDMATSVPTWTTHWEGYVDELRFWDIPLDEATINAWKDRPVTSEHPFWSHLVAYYKFDESSNPILDSKGTNNGTGYGTVWVPNGDLSLPVELTSFTARPGDENVILRWVTESEIDNAAFLVERSTNNRDFIQIAQISGQGTSNSRHVYTYTDRLVTNDSTYYYPLGDQGVNGHLTYHQVVSATPHASGTLPGQGEALIRKFKLHPAYPNPFNPETTIGLEIPTGREQSPQVRLRIFNITGQVVRTLYDGTLSGGVYKMRWDGTGDHGNRLASGVYFLRMETRDLVKTQKLISMH